MAHRLAAIGIEKCVHCNGNNRGHGRLAQPRWAVLRTVQQAVETAKIAFLTGVGWLAGIAGLERGQFYLGGFAL